MKTKVSCTKLFEKQLAKVPDHIRKKAIYWIWLVETFGILTVKTRPGFRDEKLQGPREGQHSVRLSRSYRLIYVIVEQGVHIEATEVTKHEY